MKRKTIAGLIATIAIASVVIFAGCVEEPTPEVTPTPVPTTPITATPIPTPEATATPAATPTATPTSEATATPTPTPGPAVTIAAPEEGATVSWREFVEGTSEGVYGSDLSDIYVLIYPIDAGGPWWVQPEVDVSHDGSWEVNCYFGRNPATHPDDRGARFRVCAIITTQKLSEGQQWQKLPDYVVKSETINVVRG